MAVLPLPPAGAPQCDAGNPAGEKKKAERHIKRPRLASLYEKRRGHGWLATSRRSASPLSVEMGSSPSGEKIAELFPGGWRRPFDRQRRQLHP